MIPVKSHAVVSAARYDSAFDFCGQRRVTMPKLDDQISTLQERLKQLKLRQQRIDARNRAIETMRERKAETRRQFVVGSVILAKVQEGVMDPMQLRDWLDQTLTRRDDRALFHLPPKDEALKDVMTAATAPAALALAPAAGGEVG
jgi:hypothetical protein